MPNDTTTPSGPRAMLWTSYVLTALPVLALAASAVMKFMKPAAIVQGFAHLGYGESSAYPLGVVELACTALYLIPRTSILGAILVTGYLGGATATTYRVGDSWIMAVVLGVLVWGGLFLREPRLRALIPFRKQG